MYFGHNEEDEEVKSNPLVKLLTKKNIFIGLGILSAAIELPLFIVLGKSKAMLIKIAIIMGIAFVIIGFVMFGDVTWLSELLDAVKILIWCQEHKRGIELFSAGSPMVRLVLFYLSYRVTLWYNEPNYFR